MRRERSASESGSATTGRRWWPWVRLLVSVALLGLVLLRLVDVPASDAIVMSLLLAAMTYVVSLPGAWFYVRHGLGVPEGEVSPDVNSRASRRA